MLTGASGFIGRHLTSRLLSDRRHEIFCLVRPGTPCASGVTPVLCDLARHETIESFPPVETIIHLAQSHQYRNFPIAAEDIFAINTLATARLLDYGRQRGVAEIHPCLDRQCLFRLQPRMPGGCRFAA